MRVGPRWFLGSADAIFQNLNLIRQENPEHVIVFGADHIYRMDPRQMVEQHVESGAAVTVAAVRVPRSQASQFGIIETGPDGRSITQFHEKPTHDVPGLPDAPDQVYASMGNYVFDKDALCDVVTHDSTAEGSRHDMGGDIIPRLVREGRAQVYDFVSNRVPGSTERDHAYWRDVGSLEAYYEAHMDLVSVDPIFNLYNKEWPILTGRDPMPPAKFVFADPDRAGHAFDSMVSAGVIVSGGEVRRSVLSPGVFVHSYAKVEGSVLMHNVDVGRNAIVRNAIIDKNVRIPQGARIGVDLDADRARGLTVTDQGIVVIGKDDEIAT
jgi:glucose-1-phosphate adenylyltransferase